MDMREFFEEKAIIAESGNSKNKNPPGKPRRVFAMRRVSDASAAITRQLAFLQR
jgi:hypothetical protein